MKCCHSELKEFHQGDRDFDGGYPVSMIADEAVMENIPEKHGLKSVTCRLTDQEIWPDPTRWDCGVCSDP